MEGKKKKKKKNVFKAVLLQLLVTPVFISRHTQPLHQCSLRLTVSLFAASPPPSMTSSREKRTRLRVAVGDKEWKSTNKYQKLCEVAQQKTLAAPLPHTAFTQSHCIINDQNVISSCAVTGLCPHLPPPPPHQTFVDLIRKMCLFLLFFSTLSLSVQFNNSSLLKKNKNKKKIRCRSGD